MIMSQNRILKKKKDKETESISKIKNLYIPPRCIPYLFPYSGKSEVKLGSTQVPDT